MYKLLLIYYVDNPYTHNLYYPSEVFIKVSISRYIWIWLYTTHAQHEIINVFVVSDILILSQQKMISIYVITVALAVTAVGQSTHQPFNKLSAYFEVIHKTILLNNGTMEFLSF